MAIPLYAVFCVETTKSSYNFNLNIKVSGGNLGSETDYQKNLSLDGVGLEIGTWCSPVCPKREGYHIEILDYASREDLQRELRQVSAWGQSLHTEESIEEVDYVWSGEKYAALTGKKNYYDYIIASHVIEHMVDLISLFHDCSDIIKNDGILSLTIPDKRY